LDLSHVRIIVLMNWFRTIQVDFSVGAGDLVTVGLNPATDSLVCLIERIVGTIVNDTGHRSGGKLIDLDSPTLWDGLFQINDCFSIDIAGLILIIVPDRCPDKVKSVDTMTI